MCACLFRRWHTGLEENGCEDVYKRQTKDITKRYGGLEKLGDKLLKNATMEEDVYKRQV